MLAVAGHHRYVHEDAIFEIKLLARELKNSVTILLLLL